MGQLNENDNNKNRKYSNKDKTGIDDRVAATYAKASKATLVSSLRDPYVKAFRWSTDRISDEGLICFVTNNSYIDSLPFDGMRREILKDFNYIYSLNLQGDIRKDSMRDGIPLGEENTVFGLAAMVGVAITILVKKQGCIDRKIFYKEVNFRATREEKFSFLEESNSLKNIKWTNICPNEDHVWLTENLHSEFNDFLSIGKKLFQKNKTENSSIFKEFSPGVMTGRDFITFDFSIIQLSKKINDFCVCYNTEVHKFLAEKEKKIIDIDSFVDYNNIKWSRNLKQQLKKGKTINFSETLIRESLSRPFTKQFLYFDDIIIDEIGKNCLFSPLKDNENKIILVTNHSQLPFLVQMTNLISSRDVGGRPGHCFPFFTYDKDGTNRQENITDWALETFRNHYQDQTITKWDIFHYTYAVLHHPHYRQRYAANLKRELPRIPFAPEFWPFAIAGKRLAEIHVNYEQQPEYRLKHLENKDLPIDWRVEKMRLSKDKTQIKYNEFLTLTGIPLEVFEYRLGNRSALDWIIDQYQIKTDKRSGIVNDPNRLDDEEYIVRLIKQVITISLETVQIVKNLPDLGLPKD
ncbi:MAG: type ISP restriction/modification enzyme [Snowella sp.]|nr:type ISP restriction/modification enzyme [Snowella sp.]